VRVIKMFEFISISRMKFLVFILLSFSFYDSAYCQTDTSAAYQYFQRGRENERAKKYDEALAQYDSAVIVNPSYNRTYFFRGLVRFYLKDVPGSITDYSKYIESNPLYSSAYDNRGYSEFALGQNELALKDYDKSIELNPHVAKAYLNRGGLQNRLGNYLLKIFKRL
jgi:tetratricopeptide (TPR) repeat protein